MVLPLLDRAAAAPDEAAIRSDGLGGATWAELGDAALRLATAIRAADLDPRRRVVVIAHNRPSTLLAHVAAALGEASAVPVNYRLTPTEIRYLLDESGARLVFADSVTERAVRTAVGDDPVEIVLLPDGGIAGAGVDRFVAGWPATEVRPEQPVRPGLLFTSGTTGRPKGVQLPPTTIGTAGDLAGFVEHIGGHRLARAGTHLVVGPLYHNGPLHAVRLLLAGVPVVVHERFDPEATLAAIEEFAVGSSIMVPTHFIRLLALPDDVRTAHDVSSLTLVAHTGGACPVEVKRRMIEWWGPILSESYGGTESGTVCSINSTDWLAHPGSVGRSVPPFEALVVDADGVEAPPGTEGPLYFRDATGRGIVYEGDPAKTAAAHIAPGVFTLGEIGYVDDDGFVYITDRASDMVVSGGVNLYPAEVEHALIRHPAVADVACIGLPDDVMGERLVAVVELVPAATVDGDELQRWCRTTLAGYKCPKELRLVERIPRSPMGKLDKRALRAAWSPSAAFGPEPGAG